jgi:hypothetical protein
MIKKYKEKRKEKQLGGLFFQGWRLAMLCWLCQAGFSWLLGAI